MKILRLTYFETEISSLSVYFGRNQLKDQLFMTSDKISAPTILFLEAVVMLIDPRLPWSCKIVGYLLQRNTYSLLREIVLIGKVHFVSNWLFTVFGCLSFDISYIMPSSSPF